VRLSRLLPLTAATLLLVLSTGCGGDEPGPPPVATDAPVVALPVGAFDAQVTRVVDGDTVVARVAGRGPSVRVRLLGVDTPETVKPGTPVACFGHQASAFSTALLQGRRIWAAYQDEQVDDFGRQLWDIWLPDGRFVAGLLVASGTARVLPYEPNTAHASALATAEDVARRGRRGLWAACAVTAAFPQLRGHV